MSVYRVVGSFSNQMLHWPPKERFDPRNSVDFARTSAHVEVKSCFTVLDDDGSNEVTPFEFKQLVSQSADVTRTYITSC